MTLHSPVLGEVIRLRSEDACGSDQEFNRRWAVVGLIREATVTGSQLMYRVRTSDYRGDRVERVVDLVEVLPVDKKD